VTSTEASGCATAMGTEQRGSRTKDRAVPSNAGNDTLKGDPGKDTLKGGAGKDKQVQ
jgi:Ca2+-binding RTX toxin-like protein